MALYTYQSEVDIKCTLECLIDFTTKRQSMNLKIDDYQKNDYLEFLIENDSVELLKFNVIPIKYYNKGIASSALKFLLDITRSLNKKNIYGYISSKDYGHEHKLVYFYTKNGYTIIKNNDLEFDYIINKFV